MLQYRNTFSLFPVIASHDNSTTNGNGKKTDNVTAARQYPQKPDFIPTRPKTCEVHCKNNFPEKLSRMDPDAFTVFPTALKTTIEADTSNIKHGKNFPMRHSVPVQVQMSKKHDIKECDLEFLNKSFVYDEDAASVFEFCPDHDDTPPEQIKKPVRQQELLRKEKQGCVDANQPTQFADFIKSVLSHLSGDVFANGGSTLFSSVTTVGERLIRGVTDAIFYDIPHSKEEKVALSYNGYTIKIFGDEFTINSIIFGGLGAQRLRIFLECKILDDDVVDRDSKILVRMDKTSWILSCRDKAISGSVTVEVPDAILLDDIKIQGPYRGCLCLNIP